MKRRRRLGLAFGLVLSAAVIGSAAAYVLDPASAGGLVLPIRFDSNLAADYGSDFFHSLGAFRVAIVREALRDEGFSAQEAEARFNAVVAVYMTPVATATARDFDGNEPFTATNTTTPVQATSTEKVATETHTPTLWVVESEASSTPTARIRTQHSTPTARPTETSLPPTSTSVPDTVTVTMKPPDTPTPSLNPRISVVSCLMKNSGTFQVTVRNRGAPGTYRLRGVSGDILGPWELAASESIGEDGSLTTTVETTWIKEYLQGGTWVGAGGTHVTNIQGHTDHGLFCGG